MESVAGRLPARRTGNSQNGEMEEIVLEDSCHDAQLEFLDAETPIVLHAHPGGDGHFANDENCSSSLLQRLGRAVLHEEPELPAARADPFPTGARETPTLSVGTSRLSWIEEKDVESSEESEIPLYLMREVAEQGSRLAGALRAYDPSRDWRQRPDRFPFSHPLPERVTARAAGASEDPSFQAAQGVQGESPSLRGQRGTREQSPRGGQRALHAHQAGVAPPLRAGVAGEAEQLPNNNKFDIEEASHHWPTQIFPPFRNGGTAPAAGPRCPLLLDPCPASSHKLPGSLRTCPCTFLGSWARAGGS